MGGYVMGINDLKLTQRYLRMLSDVIFCLKGKEHWKLRKDNEILSEICNDEIGFLYQLQNEINDEITIKERK